MKSHLVSQKRTIHDIGMRALLVERNLNNVRKENGYITQTLIEVECKESEKHPSVLYVSNRAFDRGLKAQPGTL